MSDIDAVKILANKEVDHVIRMISVFANLFRNKDVDFERLGVQRESDFYVGAAWAGAIDFFIFDYVKRYNHEPTVQDNEIIFETIYNRMPEINKAVSELGI